METPYPSHATPTLLADRICEKMAKAKSILTCAMFSTEFLRDEMQVDNHTLYHVLWVIEDYLDDINALFLQATSRHN